MATCKENIKKYNIPIFIPHEGCPHDCVFCNQRKITGIHTSVSTKDVKKIIEEHLGYIKSENRHAEIAFFGGSFTGLPLDVQEEFLKAATDYKDKTYGVRLSTRPDYIDDDVIDLCKRYNVRTIELGLQSADDEILRLNEREHTFAQTVRAAELVKRSGISLVLQMMIGMYGSTPQKDVETAHAAAALQPESVRIYPTLTLSGTKLESLYKSGRYLPYDMDTAVDTADKVMRIFEDRGIEIIRVGLHSDESLTDEGNIVAGPYHPAFRELVLSKRQREKLEAEIAGNGILNCIYEVECSKEEVSSIIGHKKENSRYFKERYGVTLRVKIR